MLVYHEAYDIYHCIFRMLVILERNNTKSLPIIHIRIVDFLLLFPQLIERVRLPRENFKYKKLAKLIPSKYNNVSNHFLLFNDIEYTQKCAINAMVALNLIDKEQYKNGMVLRSRIDLLEELQGAVNNKGESLSEIELFIVTDLMQLDTNGVGGIKERTSLGEHKYDIS